MDPNQFNYQQSMFNFMQNYQNPNPQNPQFSSMPTNSAAFFSDTNQKHSAAFFPSPNSALCSTVYGIFSS
ncbi:unnamed protein product [Lathyrus sativus]|nr:unnamed protein product [Lathyrus sativus]